jgi:hypothetical protein
MVQLRDAKESLKATTSKKSGVAALIQHCAVSHAAEVAVEQGIDVRNVQVVLEQNTVKGIAETKVVGYIDAPAASEEEVAVFAQRLTKACPAAMVYRGHVEWRKRGGRYEDAFGGDAPIREEQQASTIFSAADVGVQQQSGVQHEEAPLRQTGREVTGDDATAPSATPKQTKPFQGFRL